MNKTNTWWKDEIFYQIYPASFKDSNNDGVGDIRGIIEELPKIHALGITTIWISPVYKSPMVDNGYDISDYQAINPQFGTMEDLDELIEKAKQLNIKIIMDLVINHTSNLHPWFQSAIKDPNSPYRDFYIFKDGKDGLPPNNWRSNFGDGSSWSLVPGEKNLYYHHVFSPQQPDLNWENKNMRFTIYKMINWWLKKGIAGFRIDAITFIKKDQDFASITPDGSDGLGKVKRKSENIPGIEKFLTELNENTFKPANAVTVGEASGVDYSQLDDFIGNDGYFSMIFDFHYADIDVKSGSEWYRQTDWTVKELQDGINLSQLSIQKYGWGANFLENHDQPRSINKFIKDPNYRNNIGAKALATLFFFLRGCPFIFQGQELGVQNIERNSIEEFNDISSKQNYHRALGEGFSPKQALKYVNDRSRDNARIPYPWNNQVNDGFNQGHQTWLALGKHAKEINWENENSDEDSILNFYRKMIKIRQLPQLRNELINGDFSTISTDSSNIVSYQRGKNIQVYVNLSSEVVDVNLPQHKILLNNYSTNESHKLQPYQAILIEVKNNG
ncbi:alpha-glucosidase [Companilactobacillus suantsaicola]|uniref:Alpha-glucosidase n=1 Tax=Companilactobacillus suantsaicola TaxID=2487723 RepID=A0A4Z0JH75_9LACO|nr:alpha-glucosidase [Companilactobacillus suantsaicola]TGD21326.1 alpha-glucosidase [Companilactobacillus suantsaicola]